MMVVNCTHPALFVESLVVLLLQCFHLQSGMWRLLLLDFQLELWGVLLLAVTDILLHSPFQLALAL